jgi:hypothetical protein
MSFSAVFVDATHPRKRYEIARDARDPLGDDQVKLERLADTYAAARPERVVRLYPLGLYVKPWRQQKDPIYESVGGQPAPDYRPASDSREA